MLRERTCTSVQVRILLFDYPQRARHRNLRKFNDLRRGGTADCGSKNRFCIDSFSHFGAARKFSSSPTADTLNPKVYKRSGHSPSSGALTWCVRFRPLPRVIPSSDLVFYISLQTNECFVKLLSPTHRSTALFGPYRRDAVVPPQLRLASAVR